MKINRNECSVPVYVGDEELTFDPHYDTIHRFREYGHCIIRILTTEGRVAQVHTSDVYADYIAEAAECEIFERTTMGEREYETYLRYKAETTDVDELEEIFKRDQDPT